MTPTPPLAAVPDLTADDAVSIVQALLSPPEHEAEHEHPVIFGGDGTVVFDAAGRTWTLRAPTLGEFRKLAEKAEKIKARKVPVSRAATGDLDARAEWFGFVIATLGDGPTPAAADLPLWCSNPRLEFSLMAHWMAIPTRAPGIPSPAPGADPGT